MQAEDWARTKKARNKSAAGYVYVYEAEIPESFAVQVFDGLSVSWLEMVRVRRIEVNALEVYDADVVADPLAEGS